MFVLCLKAISHFFGNKHPHPITATAQFLTKTIPDTSCQLKVKVLKTGQGFSTAECSLTQDNQLKVHMVSTFGTLPSQKMEENKGPTQINLEETKKPYLVPIESCVEMDEMKARKGYGLSFYQRVKVLRNPAKIRSGKAEIEGYVKLADGRDHDLMSVALVADCFRPPVTNLGSDVLGTAWFPTMELTVYFREIPAKGWIAFNFRTNFLVNGVNEVDGELFDSKGNLVAMSRYIHLLFITYNKNKCTKAQLIN